MGILFDRLISMEPWLHDSPNDQFSNDDSPETGSLNTAAATAFLGSRWVMPAARAATPLPTHAVEQPPFDALHAAQSWSIEDGSHFVELDGFLIDRRTATAACVGLSAPIAA